MVIRAGIQERDCRLLLVVELCPSPNLKEENANAWIPGRKRELISKTVTVAAIRLIICLGMTIYRDFAAVFPTLLTWSGCEVQYKIEVVGRSVVIVVDR